MKLVVNMDPSPHNPRNSEGSFIRMPDQGIMFAYSRYSGSGAADTDCCDIAAIRSYDEGATWSEPEIIVRASDFGVKNLMSVSCIYQKDGRIGIYFLVTENDISSNLGRALSTDGYTFILERCSHDSGKAYYVINNDRIERFADGRLVVPAARHFIEVTRHEEYGESMVWVSEDDGSSFHVLPHRLTIPKLDRSGHGMQEPGIVEYEDGRVYLWARTNEGCQYESDSYDNLTTFSAPGPSVFASPCSPMEIVKNPETKIYYVVYNPLPKKKTESVAFFGEDRNPLVIRSSRDQGKNWSDPLIIENEKGRGYCYPSVFFTGDHSMLCAYCRGSQADGGCLNRLGIMKMGLDEV